MFLKNKKIFFSLVLFFLILAPSIAGAKGFVPCGHGDDPANACTLCHFIIGFKNLTDFGLRILIVVAASAIFVAGILYIVSSGNEQQVETAKNFLSASLKGFTVVLMAWFLVNITMWILSTKKDLGIKKKSGTSIVNWYTYSCSTKRPSVAPRRGRGASGSF